MPDLESLHKLALVLLAEQLLHLANSHEATQPIPLITIADEQTSISMRGLEKMWVRPYATERDVGERAHGCVEVLSR